MIVKNEQYNLTLCLGSVCEWVDEIVIVDTGSTDNTKIIAEEFNAKIIDFPWTGSFSEARNKSLEHAAGDFILVLDADEYLPEGMGPKIRILEQNKTPILLNNSRSLVVNTNRTQPKCSNFSRLANTQLSFNRKFGVLSSCQKPQKASSRRA